MIFVVFTAVRRLGKNYRPGEKPGQKKNSAASDEAGGVGCGGRPKTVISTGLQFILKYIP